MRFKSTLYVLQRIADIQPYVLGLQVLKFHSRASHSHFPISKYFVTGRLRMQTLGFSILYFLLCHPCLCSPPLPSLVLPITYLHAQNYLLYQRNRSLLIASVFPSFNILSFPCLWNLVAVLTGFLYLLSLSLLFHSLYRCFPITTPSRDILSWFF